MNEDMTSMPSSLSRYANYTARLVGLVLVGIGLSVENVVFAEGCGPEQTAFDVKIIYQVEDPFLAKMARSVGAPPELADGKEIVVTVLADDKAYQRRSGLRWSPKKKVAQPYEHIRVFTGAYSFDAKMEKGTGRISRHEDVRSNMGRHKAESLAGMLTSGVDDFVNATVIGEKQINGHVCKITQTDLKQTACYGNIQGHIVSLESISTFYGDEYPRKMRMIELIEHGCEDGNPFDIPKDITWK